MTDIIEVDEECVITYSDGTVKTCVFRPTMTFQECNPGYGPGGHCAKYDYYQSVKFKQEEKSSDHLDNYKRGYEDGIKAERQKWQAEHDKLIAVIDEKIANARVTAAAQERERLATLCRNVINTDKTGLAEALNKISILAKGYDWIPNGEWGSYDYTQRTVETLQKEVGFLLSELEKISYEGLRDSGIRVNEHIKSFEESLRPEPKQDRDPE